jgi:hypothetical protein
MKTTRTGPWRGAAALLIALAAAGCAGKPRLSDTGYEGTWGRGNERIRSTIAIARDGERWLVRIGVRSSDGSYAVRCGWDGLCEEIQDGERIYDHRFVTSVDPESGYLRVECIGTPAGPARKPVHYVEEWVVAPGGLSLTAFTVERDGHMYEGEARPRRDYEKLSDEVKDPRGTEAAR